MTQQRDALLICGLACLRAGLSLVPIDGTTKQPHWKLLPQTCVWPREKNDNGEPVTRAKGVWLGFTYVQPIEDEVREWVRRGAQLAVVGGPVSGGLLILDFDVPHFYDAWRSAVGTLAAGLPLQQTGGGGYQILVRCSDEVFWTAADGRARGNEKLAWIPDDTKRDGRSIAIETRAARGYAVIAPSLHPSGNQYVMLDGDLTAIPSVSRAHIQALLDTAVLLDEAPFTRDQREKASKATPKHVTQRSQLNGQASVIDTFNAQIELRDELKRVGYVRQGSRYYLPGNGDKLRPGVVLMDDDTKSYHWDSEDPLSHGHSNTAFDVFCHFDHGDDCKAAVKAAATMLGIQHERTVQEPSFDQDGYACCPMCGKRLKPSANGNGWRCLHADDTFFWWKGEGYSEPKYAQAPAASKYAQPSEPSQERRRSWLNAAEIDQITDPTFLIHDFLVVGEVTILAGAGDSGKTYIVVDASLRTAEHYTVMYVAGEDAPGIKLRRNAWMQFWKRPRPERFLMWNEYFSLFDEDSIREFLEQIQGLGVKLIVFDTLSQCSRGADENSSKDMGIVMGNAQRIAHETGAAVVIIHHSTKDGNGYRGSSKIKYDTYGFYDVTKNDETVELSPVRVKNTQGIKSRYFRFISVPVGNKESAVIAPASRVKSSEKLSEVQAKILTTLALMTDSIGGGKTTDLEKAVGLSNTAFYNPLKALKNKNYITSLGDKHGSPLIVTSEGRKALEAYTTNPSVVTIAQDNAAEGLFEINTELTSITSELLSDTSTSNSLLTSFTFPPFKGESKRSNEEVASKEQAPSDLPDYPANGDVQMYGYHTFNTPATAVTPEADESPRPIETQPSVEAIDLTELFPETVSIPTLQQTGYRWVKVGGDWQLYLSGGLLGSYGDKDEAIDMAWEHYRDAARQEAHEQ